jgi:hypothetical protein
MDKNTLYYFLSTVAQTMGAACGFLAAFVLLRIESWNRDLDWAKGRFRDVHLNNPELSVDEMFDKAYSGIPAQVKEVFDIVDKHDKDPNGKPLGKGFDRHWKERRDALDAVDKCVSIKRDRDPLRSNTWWSLGIAAAMVCVALVALPFVSFIKDHQCLAFIITAGELLLLAAWLWRTFIVLRSAMSVAK